MLKYLMNQKRQHTRLDFGTALEIHFGDRSQPGRSLNISTGGIFIDTAPLPEFGDRLTLHIKLPGIADMCGIPCIVRWKKDGEGAGLQFEKLRPIEVWALNKLVKSLAKD